MLKLFVVKKYIMATSAQEALKKEKRTRPDDVWIDDDWRKEQKYKTESSQVGFEVEKDYQYYDEWCKK